MGTLSFLFFGGDLQIGRGKVLEWNYACANDCVWSELREEEKDGDGDCGGGDHEIRRRIRNFPSLKWLKAITKDDDDEWKAIRRIRSPVF